MTYIQQCLCERGGQISDQITFNKQIYEPYNDDVKTGKENVRISKRPSKTNDIAKETLIQLITMLL